MFQKYFLPIVVSIFNRLKTSHWLQYNHIHHMHAAREAVIKPVYRYVHCNCQQNIALFCAISHFVLLLLFADASRLTHGDSEDCFFWGLGHMCTSVFSWVLSPGQHPSSWHAISWYFDAQSSTYKNCTMWQTIYCRQRTHLEQLAS